MKIIKNYNNWQRLYESKQEEYIEYSEYILDLIKKQNSIVEVIIEKMLDIQDILGHVEPLFLINNKEGYSKGWGFYSLVTKEEINFLNDDDYDFEEEYNKNDLISFINSTYRDLILNIKYIFAVNNNYNKIVINDIESFNKEMSILTETFPNVDFKADIDNNNTIWAMDVYLPIKLTLTSDITKYDGLSDDLISDFNSFIKDYNIDNKGKEKLLYILRKSLAIK
jgi:hypothetical protein